MKSVVLLGYLLLALTVAGFSQQEITSYSAGNGIIYRVGQVIHLNQETGNSGIFRSVYWGNLALGDGNTDTKVGKYGLTIRKILKGDNFGGVRILFKVEQNSDGFPSNYTVDIEKAIELCEIRPCRIDLPVPNGPNPLLAPPNPTRGQIISQELTRAQILLHDGEITQDEYNAYKRLISAIGIRQNTPCQQIMKLADLHKNGVLTKTEYEHLKSVVLGLAP
ncbi:MAG: SHOCT domain-containing protein [Sphingobacteriaceae bacterium]|jgi:hypothetical protein|nr:MAG: EF-hand domain-containing protein [Pedobacter sp.]